MYFLQLSEEIRKQVGLIREGRELKIDLLIIISGCNQKLNDF